MYKQVLFVVMVLFAGGVTAQCPTSGEVYRQVEDFREKQDFQNQLPLLKKLEVQCIRCKMDQDSAYMSLVQRIGAVYFNLNDYYQAALYTRKSISTALKNKKGNKPDLLVKSFFNLAMIYKADNDHQSAFAFFDSCIKYAQVVSGQEDFLMKSYKNLTHLYFFRGDYQQSVYFAEKAEQLSRALKDTCMQAVCLGEKALCLRDMKQYNQAIMLAEKALHIFLQAYSTSAFKNILQDDLAFMYSMYASIIRKKSLPKEAIQYYLKAFAIFEKGEDNNGRFVCMNNIGDTYFADLGDAHQASRYFSKALFFAENIFDSIRVITNIGELKADQKKYAAALEDYQKGLHLVAPGISVANVLENPTWEILKDLPRKEYIFTLLLNKGKAWKETFEKKPQQEYLREAMECFSLADKIVDQMLFEQEAPESKVLWREKTHKLYENAIDLCYRQHRTNDAFYYFEKSRAIVLSEQLNEFNWLLEKDQVNLSRQVRLKKNLVLLERKIGTLPDNDPEKNELVNAGFDMRRECDSITAVIRKKNPFYFKHYINPDLLTVAAFQKKLGAQAMMEFFVGDSAVYIFFIAGQKTGIKKINKQLYDSLTTSYTRFCSTREAINQQYAQFIAVANGLYKLLFSGTNLQPGRIVISPDGMFFPFESLVTYANRDSVVYFLQDFAVSYIYSAKFLAETSVTTKNPGSKQFLGIAPVSYKGTMNLSALYQSDASLKHISRNFHSSMNFISGEATRNNFLSSFNDYNIIQLYTHASDSSNAGEPVIWFSDSALYLSDLVMDHPVSTRFIFLSGCETGSGKFYRGEGVFSFNRGFAAIGIPSSVSMLWEVNNASTYKLTELFYKFLAMGYTKDVALQKAKLTFFKEAENDKKLPYYWAAPVLVGITDPLFAARHFPWSLVLIESAVVLLLLGLILFAKKINLNT